MIPMIDLKPYGAFIENTIRPLLDECKPFLDKYNVDINLAIKRILVFGTLHKALDIVGNIIAVSIIGYVICTM